MHGRGRRGTARPAAWAGRFTDRRRRPRWISTSGASPSVSARVVARGPLSISTISEGEFVCFLGPSGCGKTTLLAAGRRAGEAGRGRDPARARDLPDLPARKRNFGVVFQSYSLFPNMTVARNIAYGLECREMGAAEDRRARRRDAGPRASARPGRTSIPTNCPVACSSASPSPARWRPSRRVLLLDEPLSALDAKVRDELARRDPRHAAAARHHHDHGHPRPGRGAWRWPTASSS